MSRTRIRDFHDDDLDGIVRLWEAAQASPPPPSIRARGHRVVPERPCRRRRPR